MREVKKHFAALGATGVEPIFIHADRAPINALLAAQRAIKQHQPALVIIDPLLKFARVRDANDYAQVTSALEPLLALARESGAHVLLVYHAGKGDKSDAVDSALGSTAFAAAGDTILVLKRTERYRTLETVQWYGEDLPETVLDFDSERRAVLLGAKKSEADTKRAADAILEHLATIDGDTTEVEIGEAVEGKTADKRTALRRLVEAGKVRREGTGKKGNPYRYSLSEKCLFPCSSYIPGTRKQESENVGYPTENREQILVPEILPKSNEFHESREQAFSPSGAQVEMEL